MNLNKYAIAHSTVVGIILLWDTIVCFFLFHHFWPGAVSTLSQLPRRSEFMHSICLSGIFSDLQILLFFFLVIYLLGCKQQIINNSRYKRFAYFVDSCRMEFCFCYCWNNTRICSLNLLYFVLLTKIWRVTLFQPSETLILVYEATGYNWRHQPVQHLCIFARILSTKAAGSLIWANPWTWIFPIDKKREDLLPDLRSPCVVILKENCIKEFCLAKVFPVFPCIVFSGAYLIGLKQNTSPVIHF